MKWKKGYLKKDNREIDKLRRIIINKNRKIRQLEYTIKDHEETILDLEEEVSWMIDRYDV